MQFGKLPDGRQWGSTAGIWVDRDGTSIWVAERCGAFAPAMPASIPASGARVGATGNQESGSQESDRRQYKSRRPKRDRRQKAGS